MKTRLFVDMDGVLSNFVQGAINAHGVQMTHDEVTHWDAISERLGIDEDTFFRRIDRMGQEFWWGLDPYPQAGMILNECQTIDPYFVILTKPSKHVTSRYGKLSWMERWFPRHLHRVVFADDKSQWASEGRVLIDDSPHNTESWIEEGGLAILYPRPWNTAMLAHATTDTPHDIACSVLAEASRLVVCPLKGNDADPLKDSDAQPPQGFSSGAKSDKVTSDLSQIPLEGLQAIGEIFEEGAAKYGRDNWKKATNDPEYQIERCNHAIRHLMLFANGDRSENHLAKVGWFVVAQSWWDANKGA